jgi:hypothetical protein
MPGNGESAVQATRSTSMVITVCGRHATGKVIHRSYPQADRFHVKHDVAGLHVLWIHARTSTCSSAPFHVKRADPCFSTALTHSLWIATPTRALQATVATQPPLAASLRPGRRWLLSEQDHAEPGLIDRSGSRAKPSILRGKFTTERSSSTACSQSWCLAADARELFSDPARTCGRPSKPSRIRTGVPLLGRLPDQRRSGGDYKDCRPGQRRRVPSHRSFQPSRRFALRTWFGGDNRPEARRRAVEGGQARLLRPGARSPSTSGSV